MAKLANKTTTAYSFERGQPRGTLTIRVEGALVYQKPPGRNPSNPEPTPEQFKRITELLLAKAGVAGCVEAEEEEAYAALHAAMTAKLLALVAEGQLTASGEKVEGAYEGAAGKREMTAEERALRA